MEFVKIWAATIVLAVAYGVSHDQVTVRVCVEYFTVGHPPMYATESATLLALGWGTVATWWVGAMLGVLIAAAARVGVRPKLVLRDLLRPALVLLAAIAITSAIAGLAGYVAARADLAAIPAALASDVPARSHDRFVADWWAHIAAYATGAFGSLALCGWVALRRYRWISPIEVAHGRAVAALNEETA